MTLNETLSDLGRGATRTHSDHPYLQALARGVVVFDGGMGTMLQRLALTADDFGGTALEGCNDHLVLTRPDVITEVHEAFLAAGCDVVETATFQATPRRLGEWGLRDRARAINVAAARLAREACDRHAAPHRPRFVAGALGPTGLLPSSSDPVLSAISFAELVGEYYEQAHALAEGGVDLLLLETMQDMLEVKAAIAACQQLFTDIGRRLPVQVQVTLDTSGRMLLGTDIASALTTIEALRADAIGLNCSTGPEHMREAVRYLCAHSRLPVSVIPNAGLPVATPSGDVDYPLAPTAMADILTEFVRDFGVRIVGGCCGTTPAHIAALVTRLRSTRRGGDVATREEPRLSSALRAITMRQEPAPLIIGERLNAQGSRKVKRLLLADDYDALVDLAREQVESGAHVLDVCVATTERADEADQIARLVKQLSLSIDAPLAVDSTEPAVIERALEHIPGRALINSVNMENGRRRLDDVVPIAKRHGAALVALCIDQQGMARTREHKLRVARAIHDIVVGEYGLRPDALMFDALTFTLATGDAEWVESAVETIEGIRLIKAQLPGVFTVLGVSNVSFGLAPAARAVLNSVFLYHCVQAGLDAAIVNPAHVQPYAEIPEGERRLAEDVVFNRTPEALQRFIAHFESAAGGELPEREDPTAGLTADEKVHWMVVHRRKDGIEAALDAAGAREQPVRVLNEVLLPAMKTVGDRFGAGELILPFVLQSAEVMQKAVRHLEQFLDRQDGRSKGTIVLATVYGDVHDIGKSLVNTILANNGYTVIDLGKQAPVNTIVDKAIEIGADAIGLSALLVSTSKQMTQCVQELERRGARIPVLVGGAAINRRFGRRAWFVDGERPYAGGVFYCKDAFEGLETVAALVDEQRREAFVNRLKAEAEADVFLHAEPPPPARVESIPRSAVSARVPIPTPPFFGVRVERDLPLTEIFERLDLNELFRLQWGARGSGTEREALVERELKPRLAQLKADVAREEWLRPQAAYGFFPVQADRNDVIVYDPVVFEADRTLHELARFAFPRQPGGARLCIADYFREAASGEVDTLALQVVTVGHEATRRFEELQARGDYADALFLHGLAVETAEATAEWLHRRIREQLALAPGQGRRYSWGYGACPDVESHAALFRLLPAEAELGMQLTAVGQLVPEQSTAALVVHHPEAIYFGIRS